MCANQMFGNHFDIFFFLVHFCLTNHSDSVEMQAKCISIKCDKILCGNHYFMENVSSRMTAINKKSNVKKNILKRISFFPLFSFHFSFCDSLMVFEPNYLLFEMKYLFAYDCGSNENDRIAWVDTHLNKEKSEKNDAKTNRKYVYRATSPKTINKWTRLYRWPSHDPIQMWWCIFNGNKRIFFSFEIDEKRVDELNDRLSTATREKWVKKCLFNRFINLSAAQSAFFIFTKSYSNAFDFSFGFIWWWIGALMKPWLSFALPSLCLFVYAFQIGNTIARDAAK